MLTSLTRRRLLAAVSYLTRRDRRLRAIVLSYGPPPLWGRKPGFSTLVRIILEQQVSLASGRAVYERMRRHLGRVTPGLVSSCGIRGLRSIGVTRQKSRYCVGLAREIQTNGLRLSRIARSDDRDAREGLMKVTGIGPWTADVYLLMALRRPDVWPAGDLALHVALRQFLGLHRIPTSERAKAIAEQWKPWRSVAARILWHGYLESRDRAEND